MDGKAHPIHTLAKAGVVVSSLVAVVVLVGSGSFLAMFEQTGAQGLGSAMAFGGIIAFSAAMLLVIAPEATFASPGGRTLAYAATGLALLPVTGLFAAACLFARPLGGAAPILDMTIVAGAALLAVGAVCIAVLGASRARRTSTPIPDSVRSSAAEAARRNSTLDKTRKDNLDLNRLLQPSSSLDFDDGIKVTRV